MPRFSTVYTLVSLLRRSFRNFVRAGSGWQSNIFVPINLSPPSSMKFAADLAFISKRTPLESQTVIAAGNSLTHRCFGVLTNLWITNGSCKCFVERPTKLPPRNRVREMVQVGPANLSLTLTWAMCFHPIGKFATHTILLRSIMRRKVGAVMGFRVWRGRWGRGGTRILSMFFSAMMAAITRGIQTILLAGSSVI